MSRVGKICLFGLFILIFTWLVSHSVHFSASVTRAVMSFLAIPG